MTTAPQPPLIIVLPANTPIEGSLVGGGLVTGGPVVVLIGGAAKLDESIGDLRAIVRTVLATAQAEGATVIDGGTDAGVMALAGQARAELGGTTPLVGVVPIGRVTARGIDAAKGTTPLEPNHTHQLLAPGNEWGAELPAMIDTARALGGGKAVVGVLVDGGPLALTEGTKLLAQGWPLITIAGSGRAADDLAAIAGGYGPTAAAGTMARIHVVPVGSAAAELGPLLSALLNGRGVLPAKIEYPALYRAASEGSKRGRSRFRGLTTVELGATLVGILVAIVAGFLWPSTPAQGLPTIAAASAFVGVGAFLAAFVVKFTNRAGHYDDDWYIGRAVAEAVKSESWQYMMHVRPYDGDDADSRLEAQLSELLDRANDVRQAVDRMKGESHPISSSMRQVRALDLSGRREAYRRLRIWEQADWYRRKSGGSGRTGGRLFWVAAGLSLAAAISAFVAVYLADAPLWGQTWLRVMSFLAGASLALTAWTQINRHDELARSYAFSAQELTIIDGSAERVITDEQLAEVVRQTEDALGRENKAWLAKRVHGNDSPDPAPAD